MLKAVHFHELRAALVQARGSYGLGPPVFTDATLTGGVTNARTVHVQELRNGVK